MASALISGCGVVSAWTEDPHPCFVWVLNMLDCIILGPMDIGQEVNKQGFPLDFFHKLMVCEVNEPSGVFGTGRPLLANSKVAIHQHTQFPRDHILFQAYVLPEPSCCMVAENGLGAQWLERSSLNVDLLAPGLRIRILVLCGCSTCLIASSWAPWTLDKM